MVVFHSIRKFRTKMKFAAYEFHGLSFRYPGGWELTEEKNGDQTAITVSSPGTAFWTLSLFSACPEPEDVIAAVLDAFHEEYTEMDEYPAKARLCKRPTVARDIDFVCLELLNTARARAFRTRECTVMVLFQWTEGEREDFEPTLERITRSLSCADGEEETDE